MTRTYRCNECSKDCGTRAKVVVGEYHHFCSYRCTKLYYERSEILYEEQDRAVQDEYWKTRGGSER